MRPLTVDLLKRSLLNLADAKAHMLDGDQPDAERLIQRAAIRISTALDYESALADPVLDLRDEAALFAFIYK